MDEYTGYIRDYVQAATESSARSRRILVLLLIASILVFIAFWNQCDSSWARTHVQWAEEIETLIRQRQDQALPKQLSDKQKRILARAEDYHIENTGDAQHFHEHLLDLMAERIIYVRIPILGIEFDINDLGIFSGITLTVLLLWCRFSLWHEKRNLELCMNESTSENRKSVYRYLAMRQLLTIPPKLADEPPTKIWGFLVLVLFCLPALVYSLVVGDDVLFSGGLPKMKGLATELICEILFLVVIVALTSLCVQLLLAIHETWGRFVEDVRPPRP